MSQVSMKRPFVVKCRFALLGRLHVASVQGVHQEGRWVGPPWAEYWKPDDAIQGWVRDSFCTVRMEISVSRRAAISRGGGVGFPQAPTLGFSR